MIEQSLEKILTEISQKLENVQKDVTDIKIQQINFCFHQKNKLF
jgi:hypothetical protein